MVSSKYTLVCLPLHCPNLIPASRTMNLLQNPSGAFKNTDLHTCSGISFHRDSRSYSGTLLLKPCPQILNLAKIENCGPVATAYILQGNRTDSINQPKHDFLRINTEFLHLDISLRLWDLYKMVIRSMNSCHYINSTFI